MMIYASEAGTILMQLASAAARTTILAGVAGLLLIAFRVESTRLRLFTWIAVLYAGLAMPLLGRVLPAVRVPLPFIGSPAPAKIVDEVGPKTAPHHQLTLQDVGVVAPITSLPNTGQTPQHRSSWQQSIASISWTTAALYGYLAIALFLIARVVIGAVFSRQLVRSSAAIQDARLSELLGLSRSRRSLQIRESRVVSVPLTIGVFKATVVIPTSWREWDDEKLTSVLAHEISHVGRGDCLSQYAALLHRAVFWFSPLAWWLNRNIIELAELASDEEALTRGADQNSYARMLLGFVEAVHAGAGRVRWQGVSMANSGGAEKRLEKVLAWRGENKMATKKSAFVAAAILAIPVSYLVAAARPGSPSPAAQAVTIAQEQSPAAPSSPALPPAMNASPANPASPQAPSAASDDVTSASPKAPANPASPAAPASPDVLAADAAQDQANRESRHRGFWYRYGSDDEQRFVIMSGKSNSFTMSGSGEDARHAERLKQRIQGDFIWFERDEKSYIIRDQATIDRARQLWAPQDELGRKQAELGKQQEALGKQQEELGKRMRAVRVKVPDMAAELDKLKAELQQLGPDASVEQMGRIQSEIARLQSKMGRIQSEAGDEQGKLGEEMGALGQKQGELGRQQGELGRQQAELSEKANREMRQLLDDAIKNGIAQPETSESGGASL